MPVLSVYVSGVSTTGIEFINDAVREVFGENGANVVELGNNSLRYKVRLSSRDSSVVLVILDTVSMEKCKDIEDGLYSSDKFYNYIDDEKLVQHLNTLYGLSLKIEDTRIPDVSFAEGNSLDRDTTKELLERLTSQLADKDDIIRTLNCHINEYERIINLEGYVVGDKEFEALQSDNISLKDTILSLNSTIDNLNKLNSDKESDILGLKTSLNSANSVIADLKNKMGVLNKDLSEVNVVSSQKSGVIRDKDREIENLKGRIADLNLRNSSLDKMSARLNEVEPLVIGLRSTVDSLRIDLSNKDKEISRLQSDLSKMGESDARLEEYKSLLTSVENSKIALEKTVSELNIKISDMSVKYSELEDKNNELDSELKLKKQSYDELLKKYNDSEGFLTKLNEEKIKLSEKLRVLEQSTDRNTDTEKLMFDLSDLKRKYIALQSNIFNALSTKALPYGGVGVSLFKGIMQRLNNVQFLFSGSTESRKGTYKYLFNTLSKSSTDKYLILDVTSETAVDYVFQMNNIVDGMEWFSVGGGVLKHLSNTCLTNVKVLMPKIRYINDAFFLSIDWEKRLGELEDSGYKVIVYCGDLSNLVSRVLFESFSKVGDTTICIHGNALGSRSIITNTNGLIGIKNSKVCYYDYDKHMQSFFEIMSKKCNCTVTSYARDLK